MCKKTWTHLLLLVGICCCQAAGQGITEDKHLVVLLRFTHAQLPEERGRPTSHQAAQSALEEVSPGEVPASLRPICTEEDACLVGG